MLLQVEDLSVAIYGRTIVDGISFAIAPNETVALVGESGSGKSVTAQAVIQLFAAPSLAITGGRILFDGVDLLSLSTDAMRAIRGQEIAFISQNPLNALNPVLTIGFQLTEHLVKRHAAPHSWAKTEALRFLERVGIPDPALRFHSYPYELSGGMRQRALIAAALINHPKLLIADEATTALDVTVQAQIIQLLQDLQEQLGLSMLFITHDLGIVAKMAHRVLVMHAGQIVESGPVDDIFYSPQHLYTQTLLAAVPSL